MTANTYRTMDEIRAAGYERVLCHGQRRELARGGDWKIRLTDGVDGFGRQTGRLTVVLYRRSENTGSGWESVASRPIRVHTEATADAREPRGWSLPDYALTADIDAAVAELTREVAVA